MLFRSVFVVLTLAGAMLAQEASTPEPAADNFVVTKGTRIPMALLTGISTKTAIEETPIYLKTVFPIAVNGRIIIPEGSSVAGRIVKSKRAGKVKGKAEMYLRFDSIILPNGVTRDFRARAAGVDGTTGNKMRDEEGGIQGDSNKGQDAITIASGTSAGAGLGTIIGNANGAQNGGLLAGTLGGAAIGAATVLLTRGPDIVLAPGNSMEMTLDRDLLFTDTEIDFNSRPQSGTPLPRTQQPSRKIMRPGVIQ
jgi:type IV secretory pathway VirB10-like protein